MRQLKGHVWRLHVEAALLKGHVAGEGEGGQ